MLKKLNFEFSRKKVEFEFSRQKTAILEFKSKGNVNKIGQMNL